MVHSARMAVRAWASCDRLRTRGCFDRLRMRGFTVAAPILTSNPAFGLRVEQQRLVQVEGEGVVLADADLGVGAHARGQFLARSARHDIGVRSGRLDDLDLRLEAR